VVHVFAHCHCASRERGVCSLYFRWLLSSLKHQLSTSTKLAASPGFAPGPPVSETGTLLITPRGKWSPGKVLPLRLLGVGQTRYYFTTGRKLLTPSLGFALRASPSPHGMLLLHHEPKAVGKSFWLFDF